MNDSEHSIQTDILKLSTGPVRLFRNNVGMGWVGKLEDIPASLKFHPSLKGCKIIRGARPLHAGLINGSGDLIGWKTVTITPDMVGRRIAQFVSIECKSPHGKPSPEQETWRDNVRAAGGIGCVARSQDEAERFLLG